MDEHLMLQSYKNDEAATDLDGRLCDSHQRWSPSLSALSG